MGEDPRITPYKGRTTMTQPEVYYILSGQVMPKFVYENCKGWVTDYLTKMVDAKGIDFSAKDAAEEMDRFHSMWEGKVDLKNAERVKKKRKAEVIQKIKEAKKDIERLADLKLRMNKFASTGVTDSIDKRIASIKEEVKAIIEED